MAGIYIHIPFCRSKCAYCDFFSQPSRADEAAYAEALIHEAELRRNEVGEPFRTIYLGGGTPSLLQNDTLERIVEGVNRVFDYPDFEEFTIEANPEDITEDTLKQYKSLGINRVSIGVQSFDTAMLKSIGRSHSPRQSMKALETLASDGINFNADLIYGLPGQTPQQAMSDLDMMLSFRPPHLSAYLLSYEPGTRLYARMLKGEVSETSDTVAADMYRQFCDTMKSNGYQHYEISNYALPGRHARHNSLYWHYIPYIGLGASAHSFDGLTRRANPSNIKKYIIGIENCLKDSRAPIPALTEDESEQNRMNDYIITALRTSDGLDMNLIRDKFSHRFVNELLENINKAKCRLHSEGKRIRIPEERWLTADAILRDLIVG